MEMKPAPRLSLGPLTYYWPRERVLGFYREALSWPVDVVYLGETVCSRRHELRLADWIELAEGFSAAGKQAVLSTYELIETDADLRIMRSVVGNGAFTVEANDMGAVRLLAEQGRRFVAGPFLNAYNGETLEVLAEAGAFRWVPPLELPWTAVRDIVRGAPAGMETELFAYGRLPLAVSARCFTARYHNLTKDHCDYRCLDDPEGKPVLTQEGEPFLVLNGVQTQSARVHNLLPWMDQCIEVGANLLRLSPRADGMGAIVDAYARAANGAPHVSLPAGHEPTCDGYWHGRAGMALEAERT
jgi:O2-independent ubiquinone biosynthesis protein UbiV